MRNWWTILGLLGFLGYLPFFLPEMRLLNLFFPTPLVASLWCSLFRRRKPEVRRRPAYRLPPPAGGILPMAVRYIAAQLLMFVVLSMRRQIMRQMRGNASARARVAGVPHLHPALHSVITLSARRCASMMSVMPPTTPTRT